jgi:gliding motility-associated lipoprotein GldD
MTKNRKRQIVLFLFSAVLLACNSDYVIKRRGYYKIDLPEKGYQSFNKPGYPYSFEYPVYGKIVKDTSFFEQAQDDYWINIDFPQFNSRMHISYKEIGKQNQFDSLVNDAFTMSYKQHTYKASAIEPVPFTTPNGVEGIFFSLKGNTATANQFFCYGYN